MPELAAYRLPRVLHPLAWWVWAIGLGVAASRTTNPVLLAMIVAVAGLVVAARRGNAPWAGGFSAYLRLGLVVIAIRVVFRAVFGGTVGPGGFVLFTLPQIPLPGWASGVHLGGQVALGSVLGATYDGLRLATLLCCVGAANTLANPKRALRALPGALYEIGVAVVVALTVAPQIVESGQRILRARRLRGGRAKRSRRHWFRRIVIPILTDALSRSLALAASMDSRGYGRTTGVPVRTRRISGGLVIAGLAGLALGSYGVLAVQSTSPVGLPALGVGILACCGGLVAGGRRVGHSRYRPDPWALPEWVVAGSGVLAAVALLLASTGEASVLNPPVLPPAFPGVAWFPVLGLLVAALPAIAAPVQPRSAAPYPERVAA